MKPGSRAEFEFLEPLDQMVGVAHGASEAEPAQNPAGVLWVPDPEARHGWREFYVRRPSPPTTTRLGFGPPRSSRRS